MATRKRAIASLATGVPRGRALPHPDYPPSAYKVILEACQVAWVRLKQTMAGIEMAREDQITLGLQRVLNDMRLEGSPTVRGFNYRAFDRVIRGESICDHTGTRLGKSPDLVFRTVSSGSPVFLEDHHAVFVEAKIVDRGGHPVRLYTVKGLLRYVNGEYAWAMPSGLMLGYARDRCTVADVLVPYLRQRKRRGGDALKTRALPATAPGMGVPEPWRSTHGRTWRYGGSGARPGPIDVWHLWLDV
ncbi:MAG: hypothetical protein AB7I45_01275 [Planctomycetota bacterium]